MLALQPLAGWRCAGSRGATPHSTQLEARRLAHRRHAASAAAASRRRHCSPPAAASPSSASPSAAFQHVLDETDEEIVGWHWTGSDEFSVLEDRRDAPPLPLPPLDRST